MSDDHEARFRSHSHYVEAFALLGGRSLTSRDQTSLQSLAGRVRSSGAIGDSVSGQIDTDQVRKSLQNAWSTEVLLALPGEWAGDQDEFMRLSNSWGVVQAYYVGYHCTQALAVAKGSARPTNHPKTQQAFATLWADRPLDLPPWTFGVGHSGWKNAPNGMTIDDGIHGWTACTRDTCWSLAGKALRSTRDLKVTEAISNKRDEGQRKRRSAWESEERQRVSSGRSPRVKPRFARPQLSAADKAACGQKVRTQTLLDYLYRLRIGANYGDSALFTDGPDDETVSYHLHKRLSFLSSGTALLAEMRTRDIVGSSKFDRWADTFIANNIPAGHAIGIAVRRPLY